MTGTGFRPMMVLCADFPVFIEFSLCHLKVTAGAPCSARSFRAARQTMRPHHGARRSSERQANRQRVLAQSADSRMMSPSHTLPVNRHRKLRRPDNGALQARVVHQQLTRFLVNGYVISIHGVAIRSNRQHIILTQIPFNVWFSTDADVFYA